MPSEFMYMWWLPLILWKQVYTNLSTRVDCLVIIIYFLLNLIHVIRFHLDNEVKNVNDNTTTRLSYKLNTIPLELHVHQLVLP